MPAKFYWTPRARVVFASLGRRGKVSLPDLLAELGLKGRVSESSLVQSLARWARRGLVAIDRGARHRVPRYSLTPAGRDLWTMAVNAAQVKASSFLTPRFTVDPALKMVAAARPAKKIAKDVVRCPACSEVYSLRELREMQRQFGRVACTRCNQGLAAEFRGLEEREEE